VQHVVYATCCNDNMLHKQHNMILIFCQRFCFVVFSWRKSKTQERKEDGGEPFALQNRFFGRCCLSFPLQKKDTSAKASVWRHLFRHSERISVEWSRAKRAKLVSRSFATERQRRSLKVESRKTTTRKSKTAKRRIYLKRIILLGQDPTYGVYFAENPPEWHNRPRINVVT
jgi:hypothetical protein